MAGKGSKTLKHVEAYTDNAEGSTTSVNYTFFEDGSVHYYHSILNKPGTDFQIFHPGDTRSYKAELEIAQLKLAGYKVWDSSVEDSLVFPRLAS